jgi:hypothetical protein
MRRRKTVSRTKKPSRLLTMLTVTSFVASSTMREALNVNGLKTLPHFEVYHAFGYVRHMSGISEAAATRQPSRSAEHA